MMGFKKVYRSLQEIFPELDSRLLRAVAIEHPKDADSAVEVILTEVIPYLSATGASLHSRTVEETPSSSSGSNTAEQTNNSSSGPAVQSPDCQDAFGTPCMEDLHLQTATCPDEEHHGQFYDAESDHDQLFNDANAGGHQVYGDSNTVTLMSIKNSDEAARTPCANLSSPGYVEDEKFAMGQSTGNSLHVEYISGENYQENTCTDGEVVRVENSLYNVTVSGFGTSELSSFQCGSKSIDFPDLLNTDSMKETNDLEPDASNIESSNELVDVLDESTFTTGVTPSAQACTFDLLEDIIGDARNNKKTLFSAMESVLSLMREVELQEKAAEQAKKEAAEGDMEIFKRVEELKEMLQHAKEANDMHAGEVYGEKAILATEVRELQSRLLSLSDERDKSLAILYEMRQSLEVRLAAAEKEIEAAEREKIEKEEVGRKLLAEQEKVMEKVVQEANILKQEAEENAKLQEFLMDRGHVVDMLQGEISVICQDVRLLKEKFDERLPLSKSLKSSQTSCILASSSSSLKSIAPEEVDPVSDPTDPAEKIDLLRSFIEPESFEAGKAMDGHKYLEDEGWEIFDKRDI